ncbi:MAG: S41 family peptidase [Bacteroidota bacterium]
MENKKRRFQIWLPTIFAFMFIGGIFVGTELDNNAPFVTTQVGRGSGGAVGIGNGKVEEILRYVDARYVDNVEEEELMEDAINRVIQELDPHSNYIPARQLKAINEQLEGNFDGIGVEFMTLEDTIVIVTPLAGGPSESVGIMAGDKIIAVEDSIVAGVGKDTEEVISQLRGEKGSEVEVSILRGNEDKLRDFTIVRDEIPINSVDVAYMLDETTGYIKVNRFSAKTYEEFMLGLERLVEKEGMENLVIDVRHNPGGYLQQATNILSQLFKDRGKLLVYTEGRTVKRTDYKTSGRNFFDINNIAVLIDEGSASASEIVAGAIQDLDRGVVVGRRSFGKGLVQEQYGLQDGSALRLTVARYYTASGRSIQKDYEDLEAYDKDILERFNRGELSSIDSTQVADSLKYYTRKGRIVYGGGGIIPDIFVPIDTTYLEEAYGKLNQHVPIFIYRYLEQHPEEFEEVATREMELSDALFNEFLAYAKEEGTTVSPDDLAKVKPLVERSIAARIAKHYHGEEGFYAIWNQQDEAVQIALESLKQKNPLKWQARQ